MLGDNTKIGFRRLELHKASSAQQRLKSVGVLSSNWPDWVVGTSLFYFSWKAFKSIILFHQVAFEMKIRIWTTR